jgi:hypothetical protein
MVAPSEEGSPLGSSDQESSRRFLLIQRVIINAFGGADGAFSGRLVAGDLRMADRRDYADNCFPWRFRAVANALADGVLIGPILANKIFVDDGDGLTSEAVLVGEGASVEQANSHGVEICGADLTNIAVWAGVAGGKDASFNSE